jgi:hypothetical protein
VSIVDWEVAGWYPDYCEGLPGVYSTIWCLCYKTNELENSGKKGQWAEPNRPSKGVTRGQNRDSTVGHRGMASPPARARIRSVGTAWARRRHAVERGHVAQRQLINRSASGPVLIGSSPYTLACTAKSASGTAGGIIGRQPVAQGTGCRQ